MERFVYAAFLIETAKMDSDMVVKSSLIEMKQMARVHVSLFIQKKVKEADV
jgi:hypothetical protein